MTNASYALEMNVYSAVVGLNVNYINLGDSVVQIFYIRKIFFGLFFLSITERTVLKSPTMIEDLSL